MRDGLRRGLWATAIATMAAMSAAATAPAHDEQRGVIHHVDPVVQRAAAEAVPATEPPTAFGPERLGSTWCGTVSAQEDAAHETGVRSDPKIKVIEAVPADGAPDG